MAKSTRQLAAIMFTDIVGYTTLMGENEQQAFSLLKKNRDLQKPLIRQYGGKWLKEMGDGVLASFSSITEAVNCAVAIQNASQSESDLRLRIGIHQGEVVFEGNDVFGDGVNIAARLESLAPSGGIFISETVQRNLQNKLEFETHFVGEKRLKNVKEPVRIYEVKVSEATLSEDQIAQSEIKQPRYKKKVVWMSMGLLVIVIVAYFTIQLSTINETANLGNKYRDKSIAVLPFEDYSKEGDQQWFADGVMETILDRLAKIEELRVISRTSTDQYRETTKSMSVIAGELDVSYILEGSVQKSADKVRVTAQLIEGVSDQHIWSDTYDGDTMDIFSLQSEIAMDIARELDLKLNAEERTEIGNFGTNSTEAYNLLLRAKEAYKHLELQESNVYLEKAIKLDPEFTQVYAQLAWNYFIFGLIYGDRGSGEKAKSLIERAIARNPSNSDFFLIRGGLDLYYFNDLPNARKNVDKALELSSWPKPSINYCICAATGVYITLRDFEGASQLITLSKSIDPGNIFVYLDEGLIHLLQGQEDEAISSYLEALQYSDRNYFSFYSGWANYHTGDYENAFKYLEMAQIDNRPTQVRGNILAYLSNTHFKMGNPELSDRYHNLLVEQQGKGRLHLNIPLAMIYAARGDNDEALNFLTKAYQERDIGFALYLNIDPIFDDLRENDEFIELINRSSFKATETIISSITE